MTGWRHVCVAFALLVLVFSPESAWAAKLRTEIGARKVGVGQGFEVKVTATQEEGEAVPSAPNLEVRGKAQVRGPSVGTQRTMTMRNFSFDSQSSVVATWVVTPTATGKLVIGPGTFQVGSKTLRGETIVVEVVEEPQQVGGRDPFGRRGSIFGPDPRDVFGDDPFDLFSRRMNSAIPEAPEKYQVKTAPDPIAFLRLLVDKDRVVLGEPVRVTVIAYGSRGGFQEVSPNEPALSDFLSYSVLESSHDEPTYQTDIEGQRFLVKKLREYIVIPLKTGSLTIGGMTAVLQGNRTYPTRNSPLGMKVQSPDVTVTVTEAPMMGRPKGYFPGDVGSYQLKADVTPRALSQGDYAEVVVQIRGRGQIPTKVLLPEHKDLVWEPPTMDGGPEIQDGELRGTRVLKYALQVRGSGTIDLGRVELPYYDHFKNRYQTAQADLGEVTVDRAVNAPGSTDTDDSADAGDKARDPVDAGVPLKPRAAPFHSSPRRLPEPPALLWWALAVAPAVVGTGAFGASLFRRFARSTKSKEKSQTHVHLKEARRALDEGRESDASRNIERALYEALDRATGERNRGFLREHLAAELARAGLEEDLAERCKQLLVELEQTRYDVDTKVDRAVLDRASALVGEVGRAEKKLKKKRAIGEVSA